MTKRSEIKPDTEISSANFFKPIFQENEKNQYFLKMREKIFLFRKSKDSGKKSQYNDISEFFYLEDEEDKSD